MHRVQREVLARWPDDTDALQAMVGVSMREGRAQLALHDLEKLLVLDPQRLVPRAWYTAIVGNLRGISAGLEAAEEFVRLHPDSDLAWFSLSVARQRGRDREGARSALERALELDGDDLGLREQWALLALNDGDTGLALAELDRIAPRVANGPISTDFLRARILHEIGRTGASIAILDSLFDATAIPTLLIVEAMILNESGRHTDARAGVERATEVVGHQGKRQFYRHHLLLERGLARIGTDSTAAAEEDLRLLRTLAAESGPYSAERTHVHTLSARLSMHRGDFATARAHLDSIALDHSAFAHVTLGAHRERELRWKVRCLEQDRQLAMARALLESDLARTRHRPRIHFDRARLAWAMGDTTKARMHLDEALARFASAEPGELDAIAVGELAKEMSRPAPR
jgi:tetratricopeptide (TPR) repeat protein